MQIPQDTVRKLENGMTWQKIWWFKWLQKVAAIQMKQESQVIHVGHCVSVPNGPKGPGKAEKVGHFFGSNPGNYMPQIHKSH